MATFDGVKDLELTVESYSLKPLTAKISGVGDLDERKCTLVEFNGLGKIGVGEDVTYLEDLQDTFVKNGANHSLAGTYTFAEFSKRLGEIDWVPDAPEGPFGESFRNYRRWALESAALDLALQQNNLSLSQALGREVRPLNFVASMRLGEPSSFEPIRKRLEKYPSMRFKLDPTNDWADELIDQIAATGAADTMDFKGFYKGTPVEAKTDPALYKKIVDKFPNVWLEDPDVTDETRPILEPVSSRVTWDFPIHDVASLSQQAFPIKCVNIKPSRFGPIEELFATYDYCNANGIKMYSGGQTEIGPGRGQVQYLSALFHADAPNDIAPAVYNSADTEVDLPQSPLKLNSATTGFHLLD